MKRIKKIDKRQSDPDRPLRYEELINGAVESGSEEILRLDDLCGTWESVNLNPSLLIYRDRGGYRLSMIHIAESGQASPSTYDIGNEDGQSYVTIQGKAIKLSYDPRRDELSLEGYGSYLRNE